MFTPAACESQYAGLGVLRRTSVVQSGIFHRALMPSHNFDYVGARLRNARIDSKDVGVASPRLRKVCRGSLSADGRFPGPAQRGRTRTPGARILPSCMIVTSDITSCFIIV